MVGRDILGPSLTTGEIFELRVIVPLKPFIPLMVIVKVAELPLAMVWLVGVAVIVKSWVPVTVTETEAEWNSAPPWPLTVTV